MNPNICDLCQREWRDCDCGSQPCVKCCGEHDSADCDKPCGNCGEIVCDGHCSEVEF